MRFLLVRQLHYYSFFAVACLARWAGVGDWEYVGMWWMEPMEFDISHEESHS